MFFQKLIPLYESLFSLRSYVSAAIFRVLFVKLGKSKNQTCILISNCYIFPPEQKSSPLLYVILKNIHPCFVTDLDPDCKPSVTIKMGVMREKKIV